MSDAIPVHLMSKGPCGIPEWSCCGSNFGILTKVPENVTCQKCLELAEQKRPATHRKKASAKRIHLGKYHEDHAPMGVLAWWPACGASSTELTQVPEKVTCQKCLEYVPRVVDVAELKTAVEQVIEHEGHRISNTSFFQLQHVRLQLGLLIKGATMERTK